MADVQLEKGYLRVATELMDELIRRDFSKRQIAILHLIIRLSYGCHRKDCVIEKLNDFEIAGVYKTDIKKELNYLVDTNVIDWERDKNIFSLKKNYESWQINPSKGWDKTKLEHLVHLNLKQKKVSKTLTSPNLIVSKTLTEIGVEVSETLTAELVKHLLELFGNAWESKGEDVLKDSIKDIYLKIYKDTTTTTGNSIVYFEKLLCRLSVNQIEKLYMWLDEFSGQADIVKEAIDIADSRNKRTFGFVEFLLREWKNNSLATLERIRVYEQEKFNKTKRNTGQYRKPIRQEKIPEYFKDEYVPNTVDQAEIELKKQAIKEKLKKFRE